MRIGAQPLIGGFGQWAWGGLIRVGNRAAVDLVGIQHVLQLESLWIGQAVPSPLRHRGEQDVRLMKLGKSLKPRDVGRKRKLTVADRQRGERIGVGERDVMARHQRPSIDGRCGTVGWILAAAASLSKRILTADATAQQQGDGGCEYVFQCFRLT